MRMQIGYTVELAQPRGNGKYDYGAIPLADGSAFQFTELREAVNAAREYQQRNPEHDGNVRVSGLGVRLFPDNKPMRVRVNGQTVVL